jgi:hypothetical protein
MIIDTHPPIEIPFEAMTRAQKIVLRDALMEAPAHEDSEE